MKKLVLTTVCALAITGSAFAQGYLNWSTIPFAAMTAQTNSVVLSPLFGGGPVVPVGGVAATPTVSQAFYYELLYTGGSQILNGASSPSNSYAALFNGGWKDTGLMANNSAASAGRLVNISGTAAASVPWAAGTTDNIVLVGWSANIGTAAGSQTWLAVSNVLANWTTDYSSVTGPSFFGVTAVGFLAAGASSVTGTTVFANSAGAAGLPIYSLNTPLYLLPVPEPATMALAGLGGLSLLLFRRRRQ